MLEEKSGTLKMPHNIVMENRQKLVISGVSDVESFEEDTAVVYTDMGALEIQGTNLKMNRLNTETGELSMEGKIDTLSYREVEQKGGGFFSKVFK